MYPSIFLEIQTMFHQANAIKSLCHIGTRYEKLILDHTYTYRLGVRCGIVVDYAANFIFKLLQRSRCAAALIVALVFLNSALWPLL